MKIKTIYIPIYGIEFHLYDDLKQIGFPSDLQFGAGLEWNWSQDPMSKPKMAFKMNAITMGRIAHECSHLIFRIYARAGIDANSADDEHFAYLLEYLVNKVSDALLQHKKKMEEKRCKTNTQNKQKKK